MQIKLSITYQFRVFNTHLRLQLKHSFIRKKKNKKKTAIMLFSFGKYFQPSSMNEVNLHAYETKKKKLQRTNDAINVLKTINYFQIVGKSRSIINIFYTLTARNTLMCMVQITPR